MKGTLATRLLQIIVSFSISCAPPTPNNGPQDSAVPAQGPEGLYVSPSSKVIKKIKELIDAPNYSQRNKAKVNGLFRNLSPEEKSELLTALSIDPNNLKKLKKLLDTPRNQRPSTTKNTPAVGAIDPDDKSIRDFVDLIDITQAVPEIIKSPQNLREHISRLDKQGKYTLALGVDSDLRDFANIYHSHFYKDWQRLKLTDYPTDQDYATFVAAFRQATDRSSFILVNGDTLSLKILSLPVFDRRTGTNRVTNYEIVSLINRKDIHGKVFFIHENKIYSIRDFFEPMRIQRELARESLGQPSTYEMLFYDEIFQALNYSFQYFPE